MCLQGRRNRGRGDEWANTIAPQILADAETKLILLFANQIFVPSTVF